MLDDNLKYHKTKEFVKRYLPVSAIILLTLFLMIFFRYNKRNINKLIEQGKNNLVSFYAQNLKPLFAQTEISNEDVFNFALYQSLPIDKQNNRVLLVSNENAQNQIYEIRPGVFNSKTNNYEKFVNYLGWNNEQKDKADSILNTYKKEIYLSVLMNDKNTVAVSPKLAELQRAVLADLLTYGQKINAEKANELFSSHYKFYHNKNVSDFIISTKEIPQDKYIFITPDTVFQTVCNINTQQLDKQLSDIEKNKTLTLEEWKDLKFEFEIQNEAKKDLLNASQANIPYYSVKIDSNIFKVVIPSQDIKNLKMINGNVKTELDKVAEKMRKLKIKIDTPNKYSDKLLKPNPPKLPMDEESLLFELNIADPVGIANKALEILSSTNFKDWGKIGVKMDSIARAFETSVKDSLMKNNKTLIDAYKKKNRTKGIIPNTSKDTLNK